MTQRSTGALVMVGGQSEEIGARFWLKRLGFGFILGAAIATLDFAYYFPLATHAIGVDAFLSSIALWCGEGVLFALVLSGAEYSVRPRELRTWQLALAVVLGVLFAVLAWQAFAHFLLRDQFGMRLFTEYLGQPANWMGGVLYHAWMLLFFGGLATVAAASQRRYARMLAALRAAELARATSQRGLADAKLASLQARIPPNFLFQTLTKLERLYAADPASADRLLDELIDFLHRALGDMRASTVPSPPPVRAPHVVFHSSN
jgi:hypothetical protein